MADYASEGGHWYLPDGTPYYTYTDKNGNECNVTLREARKVNASPSVSEIIKMYPAYQLEKWKRDQVIFIAHENPRGELEGMQAYADRIQNISSERGKAIMDLGTKIHGDIEKAMTDTVWTPTPEAHAAIQTLNEWAGSCCWRNEKSFTHKLGYGGKCDAHKSCEHNGEFVNDIKTKDFDETWVPAIYDNHVMQLKAYAEGFGMPMARCAIIFVSTKVPGLVRLVEAPQSQLDRGWRIFKATLNLWQVSKKYVPNLEPRKEPVDA
jgi:hypothetical protein